MLSVPQPRQYYCKDFGQSSLLFAYRGFCYSVTSELVPWTQAVNYCQQHFHNVSHQQASLLIFDEENSNDEFQYIKQIFMSYNQSATKLSASIGFSYQNNTWIWLDGRKVDFRETPPSIYATKNSIFPYEQLMCGIIELRRLPNETKFGLMQQECLTPERVFCKLEVDYCFENDKCGLNGVCSNEDGEFRCECAFLYDGVYCDEYSSEAIQVIIASLFVGLACIVIAVCKKAQQIQNKTFIMKHYEQNDVAARDHLLNLNDNKSLNKFKQIGSICFQKFPKWIHHSSLSTSSLQDSCSKPSLPPSIPHLNHLKQSCHRSNRHRTKTKTSNGLLTFVQSFLTVAVAGVAIVYICVRRTSSIYDYDQQYSKQQHNHSLLKLKDSIGLKSSNDENRTVITPIIMKKSYICRLIGSNYVNQNVFMLPFSALLTFILFLLYQTIQQASSVSIHHHHHQYRWFFQRLKFPIILNPFQKTDRFHTVILFGVISNQIINLLIEVLLKPQTDIRLGILFDLIRRLGLVILCGARYFPILISLNVHCLTSTFLTSLFITFDLGLSVYCEAHCIQSLNDHLSSTISMIHSSSRVQLDIARIHYVLAKCLPHYVALAHIMARFYTLTLKHFLYLCKGNERWSHNYKKSTINTNTMYNTISKEFDNDWYYTKSLMKHGSMPNYYLYTSQLQTQSKTFKEILHKFYKPRPYFRYSLLVLFTYTVSFLVLYYLTCLLIFSSTFTLRLLMTVTGNILMKLIQLSPITINIQTANFEKLTFTNEIFISAFISAFIYIIQLLLGLKQYQLHMLKYYRGAYDKQYHLDNSSSVLAKSFHYSGYQVGYLAYGFVIINYIVFIICLFLRLLFIHPLLIKFVVKFIAPLFILYALKHVIIYCLTRYFFSHLLKSTATTTTTVEDNTQQSSIYCTPDLVTHQEHQQYLFSLENRHAYFLFVYFNFFFDCFLGIISCIIRLFKSTIAVILYMPRLDYSIFGRTLEQYDVGYTSYISYIYVESIHTHPILISFTQIVYMNILKQRLEKITEYDRKKQRIKFKWLIAYTLLKNLSLITTRKQSRKQRQLLISSSLNRTIIDSTTNSGEKQHIIMEPFNSRTGDV
ncbi:unnamed protein product [Didymodactylos carnosus]|uniref:C-type lectin domain-containing protein n=1 Tax=Didymodactylos carnosus TaxID=1234261 RepID=A0A814DNQ8_9BILA|nr:unnamed protein product [Didymodactylos carnosus]CAF3732980.1 unnamed protein product [Didymodactylos carnosus]